MDRSFEYKINLSVGANDFSPDVEKILKNAQKQVDKNPVEITITGDQKDLIKQLLDLKKQLPGLNLADGLEIHLSDALLEESETGKKIISDLSATLANALQDMMSNVENIDVMIGNVEKKIKDLEKRKLQLFDGKNVKDASGAFDAAEERFQEAATKFNNTTGKVQQNHLERMKAAYQDMVNFEGEANKSAVAVLSRISQSMGKDVEKYILEGYQSLSDIKPTSTYAETVKKINEQLLEQQGILQQLTTHREELLNPTVKVKGKLDDNFKQDIQDQIDELGSFKVKVEPEVDKNVDLDVSVKTNSDSVKKVSETIKNEEKEIASENKSQQIKNNLIGQIEEATSQETKSVKRSQEEIQADIERTNEVIKIQRDWLRETAIVDKDFKTSGKGKANDQLRWATRQLLEFRTHPERFYGTGTLDEDKINVAWYRSYKEAERQGSSRTVLSQNDTDIREYTYNRSLENLTRDRNRAKEILKEAEADLIKYESELNDVTNTSSNVLNQDKIQEELKETTQAAHEAKEAMSEVVTSSSDQVNVSSEDKIQEELQKTTDTAKKTSESVEKAKEIISRPFDLKGAEKVLSTFAKMKTLTEDIVDEDNIFSIPNELITDKSIVRAKTMLKTFDFSQLSNIGISDKNIDKIKRTFGKVVFDFEEAQKRAKDILGGKIIGDINGVAADTPVIHALEDFRHIIDDVSSAMQKYIEKRKESLSADSQSVNTTATDEIKEGLKEVQEQAKETGEAITEVKKRSAEEFNKILNDADWGFADLPTDELNKEFSEYYSKLGQQFMDGLIPDDKVLDMLNDKYAELLNRKNNPINTDIIENQIEKELSDEESKVNEVVNDEVSKFGDLETELREKIPGAIDEKNKAFDKELEKVNKIVDDELNKFSDLENKIKNDIPKAIEEKNTSLEAERGKVKEVVDAEVEMFGGLEGAINGVKNAIDGKNNSVDEAKKKGSEKKKGSGKKKSNAAEENSSEESSESTTPLFYENDTLKKYLLGVQDRFNKKNLKLGVELDKAAFEAEFKKAADEVAQDFNKMFGTSITGKDVVNAIKNIEKEEASAAEQAKKDAKDVELEYGKVLADARQAEQELSDAQKKKGQEFLKENEEYIETKLINERNESYEKLIATIDEYGKMKKRVLTGEKVFGDSNEALDRLKDKINTLFSNLEKNPVVDNKFNKIIDRYISVEEKASKLEMLKTSEKKYGYLGTLADKYVDARKNGNDVAANKYKEQFEKTKEFLRNTESYNEKLEREAVNNFIRLNNELEESEKKAYKEMVDNNVKELNDLGKQQQKQGRQFIEEGERYNKKVEQDKTNEVLMERKILYDELIEAIEKYSEMSKRIASGERISGDNEKEAQRLKSNAKRLLSEGISDGILTDSQINNAMNKYSSIDDEVKRLSLIRKSRDEYDKLTKIVNAYADTQKRIATGKALDGDIENAKELKKQYTELRNSLRQSDLYSEKNENQAMKRLGSLGDEINKAKISVSKNPEEEKRNKLLSVYISKLKEQAKYEEQIKALRKNGVSDSDSKIVSRNNNLKVIQDEITLMGNLNLTEEENLNIQNKIAQARRQYAVNAQNNNNSSAQKKENEAKQKYVNLLKEENALKLKHYVNNKTGIADEDYEKELENIENRKQATLDLIDVKEREKFVEEQNAIYTKRLSEEQLAADRKLANEEESLQKKRLNLVQQITQWLKSNPIAEKKYGSILNEDIDKLNSSAKLTPEILKQVETEFKNIKLEATKAGDTGSSFFTVLKQRWQSLGAYLGSFASFYKVVEYIHKIVDSVKELDSALTEMRKVSDESVETLKAFQKESFDIAAQVGSTAKVIQNSTADWMRLGESLNEAKESAKNASILLNVSEFESIDEATTALIAMSQAYKDMDKIDIIDKLNNIGNNFSISTDQLATGLQNAAAVLKTQGNDIDKSIALLTAANSIVQDISKASTGIRTIALRIAGTETAKEELEELGESVDDYIVQTQSKTQETIRAYTAVASNAGKGINVLDANGNLRDTYDILLDISKVYKEIQEEDKKAGTNRAKALVEYIAGKNRSNIAASVLENPELLEKVYEASQDSAGSALEENEKYLDSIAGHLAQLQNQLQKLYSDTVSSDFIKWLVDILTNLTKIVDKVGLLNTAFVGLATVWGSKKLGYCN